MRVRVTEEKAKWLANEFRKTGDVGALVSGVSEASAWLGRFGKSNRRLFVELLVEELGKGGEG